VGTRVIALRFFGTQRAREGEFMSDIAEEETEASKSHFEAPHPPRVNPSSLAATVLLAVLLLCIAIVAYL
jgi:hypothetical protein